MIWKGRVSLLCYSPTFPLLRVSRGRALEPCAYLANSKGSGNYYAQRKKMHDREELNSRTRLWYHARGPSSTSPTIKYKWYGKGDETSYVIVQHFPSFVWVTATRSDYVCYLANNKVYENYYVQRKKMCGWGKLNPKPRLWYHARRPPSRQSYHKIQVIWKQR
jgi:hypothetical protein